MKRYGRTRIRDKKGFIHTIQPSGRLVALGIFTIYETMFLIITGMIWNDQ